VQTRAPGSLLPVTAAVLLSMHGALYFFFWWCCSGLRDAERRRLRRQMCVCTEVRGCSVPLSLSRPPPGLALSLQLAAFTPLVHSLFPESKAAVWAVVQGWESHTGREEVNPGLH